MLNALRHQRFRHLFHVGNHRACSSVLNALRHQRFRHDFGDDECKKDLSAQRLTASKVSALGSPNSNAMSERCSTPYGIKGFGTPQGGKGKKFYEMCSTPYGIKGFGTKAFREGCRNYLSVLNALRHQRFRHKCMLHLSIMRTRCSTPYGIKGFGTRLVTSATYEGVVCSTPYGIKGFGTVGWQESAVC